MGMTIILTHDRADARDRAAVVRPLELNCASGHLLRMKEIKRGRGI